MKILPMVLAAVALVWATGLAACGYRDLNRDMGAYTPPAMIQQAQAPVPPVTSEPDAFEAEKATIARLRDRWEKGVESKALPAGNSAISTAIIAAADDDARTLDLLRPRFSLQTVQALILLRNPSVESATHRFRASLEGFDQVTQLDEILRQYSAFTEAVMPGVGPMQGMDAIQMKFPFPGVTALKGQVAEKNVEAEKQALDLVRRDIVARGSKAYWNLLYIHRAQRITRDTLEQLNHLESVATTRYGAGKTSYQDVVKIRIGREKLEEQLATLKEQRVNLETELLGPDRHPAGNFSWLAGHPNAGPISAQASVPLFTGTGKPPGAESHAGHAGQNGADGGDGRNHDSAGFYPELFTLHRRSRSPGGQRRDEADICHHGVTRPGQRPAQECLVRHPGHLSQGDATQTRCPEGRSC